MSLNSETRRRLQQALAETLSGNELADAIDKSTAELLWTPTVEHGVGVIGTGVAPTTHRRAANGHIITDIKVDLKGLACKGDSAADAIGLAAGGAAFIGRYVVALCGIVYRVELMCVQSPGEATATITSDIDLARNASGAIAYDGAVGTVVVDTGGIAAGKMHVKNDPIMTANDYLYLVEGDTAANTGVYSAGQVIVRLHGHPVFT